MKKGLLLFIFFMLSFWSIKADAQALWLRYPAISPNGKWIVFEYKGDLYKVSSQGGDALQLTTNPAYDYRPVWSPDGSKIAFASDRNGNFDIYTISEQGGNPQQLSYFSGKETPTCFSPDGKSIYFNATIQDNPDNYEFPISLMSELYKIPVNGGRIEQVLSTPAEFAQLNKVGDKIIYHDRKGYEDVFRKHHTSSIARDIWIYDAKTGKHTKLTTFAGEDRNPLFGKNEKWIYFLTEQFGSCFNVARFAIDKPTEIEQLTKLSKNPVRFLTMSKNELMVFSYNGELYTFKVGAEPQKLKVNIRSDENRPLMKHEILTKGATEMAVSPNGKEVAFVVRGEIYVTLIDGATTKRITNTPEQERSVSFSPDGKAILYASERNNSWNVYQTKLVRAEDKYFSFATLLKEEPVIATQENEEFQPEYSPDGKEVAYLENRTTLKIINLATKKVRKVLDGKYNYSYSDGDQWYQWSPDGKWFLVNFAPDHFFRPDVGLVDAQGNGNLKDLTNSGYNDNSPKFMAKGKVILWFSDERGMRSHGSWGSQFDVYGMFLTEAAFDDFKLTKNEDKLLNQGDKKDKSKDKKNIKKEVKPLKIDWRGLEDRKVRMTIHSSALADAVLSPDAKKLYYICKFDKKYNLWMHDFKKHETKQLVVLNADGGQLFMDKKGENLFVFARGKMMKINIKSKKKSNISYKAEFNYNYLAEKKYIFEHAWRQMNEKFYDPKMHGVDWKYYKTNYEKFLPFINNNHDFAELLSEMLGELNGSHTGGRYYPKHKAADDATASLGALYDWNYKAKGMKIVEVMNKSPLISATSKIKAGTIIKKINGQSIETNNDFYKLMNHLAGKRTLLGLTDGKNNWEEVVKPISLRAENQLLYERWVNIMRAETKRLSGGKLGYVHVRSMNDASFRKVYSDVFGRYAKKEAIIIDTRFNGGGWLHDDLAVLFSGKKYVTYAPRGIKMGYDPMSRWWKPSILLMSESNYSDAHGFPYVYTTLKIGKTVGMPVPGTMTAVWWERQIDNTLIFGIPEVGSMDMNGQYLENHQLEPDYKVRQDYDVVIHKHDQQLAKAVEVLLKTVK